VSEEVFEEEYRCPGETYTISRAVHLARLAGYYALCRECPRREDTRGLSARQARRVAEAWAFACESSSRGAERLRNVTINAMTPAAARAVAVEFARQVLDGCGAAQPVMVFASDGRLSTAAIVAAIAEGIRWSGCEAIDLGAASVPCVEREIEQVAADGGIFLGNPCGAAHMLGMKFWIGGKAVNFQPAAEGASFTPTLLNRPARSFGPLRRVDAAEGYLNELRPDYHAMRPLRFVLGCSCQPVISYLNDLLQNVACRLIPSEPGGDCGAQVSAAKAHFGIEITDDGTRYSVVDEHGRGVPLRRLVHAIPTETDALRALTHLLVLLSRDDRSFSTVLDRADRAE
jgi:phosphomannomutase